MFNLNFDFLFKISIFLQNFDISPKFRFLSKISMFVQNFDISPKFRFLSKISEPILSSVLDCENEYRWKPVQIAECWNRKELVQFLTNPMRERPPSPKPVVKSQQEKMEHILKQRQQREQHLEKQREMVRQQQEQHPQFQQHPLSLFPKFNRRKSRESLTPGEPVAVEVKGRVGNTIVIYSFEQDF